MTDEQLIQAFGAGDHTAFKELVRRYEHQVAATVIGMLGPGPEAEDVGQDVFIRFYQTLDRFRGESALGTYLTRIAINLSLNALKRRKRRRLRFRDKPVEEKPDLAAPDDGKLDLLDREIVQKAVRALDPPFRSVIVLRLMEGYSTRETADILKIPEGTVLSRLARAQKKLKTILTPYFGASHERNNSRVAASVV